MAVSRKQARGFLGVSKLRLKLRKIHKHTENTIKPVLDRGAAMIERTMENITPEDTGRAVGKIDYKVSRDGLTAKIGIRTKARARAVFYFAFLDSGTKGSREHNIPPMPALNIRARSLDANKDAILRDVKREIDATLKRAARNG